MVYAAGGDKGLLTLWHAPGVRAEIQPERDALDSAYDGVSYTFPPGVLPGLVTATHRPRYPGHMPSTGELQSAGLFFEMETVRHDGQAVQPNQPFTLKVNYRPEELGGLAEEMLGLYEWDGQKWVKEPSSAVDPAANTITAHPDSFTLWAVLGKQQERIFLPLIRAR
jgi:hypothetical protein